MTLSTQPYKGTRDFYPKDMRLQKWMFQQLRKVVEGYGYLEYEGPMLESFELYAAKTGEEIVENQLYWFEDRGKRKVALRPEMTPTMARMVAGQLQELPKPIRWYSLPNLWRYERPQRGRLREHWQLNVDLLGGDKAWADLEILKMSYDIMKSFRGDSFVKVHINNRKLINHFFQSILGLSSEEALKVSKAVDARAKIGEEKYQTWLNEMNISPQQQTQIEQFFNSHIEEVQKLYPCEGTDELTELFNRLKPINTQNTFFFDPKIMRGLDYYTGTVFEVYDTSPDNNRSMFGGGRYDNLVGLFGKQELSGIGFGMGDVTLKNFLEIHHLLPQWNALIDVFVAVTDAHYMDYANQVSERMRQQNLHVATSLTAGKLQPQLKQAHKNEALFAVIIGDEEFQNQNLSVKNLSTGEQTTNTIEEACHHIKKT